MWYTMTKTITNAHSSCGLLPVANDVYKRLSSIYKHVYSDTCVFVNRYAHAACKGPRVEATPLLKALLLVWESMISAAPEV